ncbi:MAG: PilZ domain-containing protein [Treponema sp.]|nr:PilZ domain-containing protein [Treponema sp.]
MSTPVKLIEKEFLLKALYEERIPIIFLFDRFEYILHLERPVKDTMFFRSEQLIGKLKTRSRMEMIFNYRGKVIVFNVELMNISEDELTCTVPDFLYKNLDRSYSRVNIPSEMQVQFTFHGDRYNLSFPKITDYDTGDFGEFFENIDPKNLSGLIDQMAAWIKTCASGYRLVIYKDTRPTTVEERVISELGKTLFLPSTRGSFPQDDPYPRKRIITGEIFKRYLEGTGVGNAFVGSACDRFIKAKADSGIFSDAWIPIHFQDYVIGYIHIWISDRGLPSFDYSVVDTLYQFAKVLSYSLKINGYFEQGKVKTDTFEGKVIDISASGLLFAYPHSDLSSALQPDSELMIKLITPECTIMSKGVIVRGFRDSTLGYYGCQFREMELENLRYLFEYIYGKPFTEFDASFLAGQV